MTQHYLYPCYSLVFISDFLKYRPIIFTLYSDTEYNTEHLIISILNVEHTDYS